jgi:bidirectional [NiFe] hydrogenase diaphorase subunit
MIIHINGRECTCEKGEFLLTVARRNGFIIPTLCHHEAILGQGCCRLCIVEIEDRGRRQVVVSCVYPVEKEIDVYTDSDKIRRERGMILRLLQKRAPDSPEIQGLCSIYHAPEIPRFLSVDGGKCVLCGLCAKACAELSVGAISTVNRGVTKEVCPPYHEPSSVCVGCGSCAAICPTCAIPITETADSRTIWGRTFRLVRCAHCGKPIGTEEELACAAQKAGEEPDTLCPDCRKAELAKVFAHTYGTV